MESIARIALRSIMRELGENKNVWFRCVFADGSTISNTTDNRSLDLEIVFRTRGAEWRSIVYFYHGLIEAYIDGDVELRGERPLSKLAEIGHAALASGRKRNIRYSPLVYFKQLLLEYRNSNKSVERARLNAEAHYGLDPRFFEYKLGKTIGYTEGYWVPGTQSLDQAQYNHYEHICRKLRLQPKMKVLEVGSGWGFLPIFMVKRYDVDVTVYNPVRRQNEYMRARFARHGVADRIRLVEDDHRAIAEEGEAHDRFVSIGVQEHAGLNGYRLWISAIAKALKPGGGGVISTTSLMHRELTNYLAVKYIFPGGHIPSLPLTLEIMDDCGLTYVQVENLWPHYKRTLESWLDNINKHWHEIEALDPRFFTSSFRRKWNMYLEGTIENFSYALDLSYITFAKGRERNDFMDHAFGHPADFLTGDAVVDCYP